MEIFHQSFQYIPSNLSDLWNIASFYKLFNLFFLFNIKQNLKKNEQVWIYSLAYLIMGDCELASLGHVFTHLSVK